jgi:hypothetical protein
VRLRDLRELFIILVEHADQLSDVLVRTVKIQFA